MITAAIGLTLLAVLAVGVAAQDEAVAGPVTFVTGQSIANSEADPGSLVEQDGVGHVVGITHDQTIEWSDPRLPSSRMVISNANIFQPMESAAIPFSSVVLLEDGEGSWTGTALGYFEGAFGDFVGTNVLVGHGAYDGLTAVLYETPSEAAEAGEMSWEGIIFEGAMPSLPDGLSVE